MLVRGCPGCAALGSSIVTKLDEEDNGDHHPDWCDEEVHQQLGTGFWAETAGEVRDAGQETFAPREEESPEEQVRLGQSQVGQNEVVWNSRSSAVDRRSTNVKVHLRYCAA